LRWRARRFDGPSPEHSTMKYFPQRLWLGFNNRRPSKRDAAFKEWEKNFRIYKRSLRGILPKLSPSARKFFATALLLHDATLRLVETGDQINDLTPRQRRSNWNRRAARVRLHVLSADEKYLYLLDYRLIRGIVLDFPGPISLFPAGAHPNFGDWGYDELSLKRKSVLQHEILFSSGAAISIEFEKVSVRRRRLETR